MGASPDLRIYVAVTSPYLWNRGVTAQEVLKEAHDGVCGAHQLGPKLKDRLHRLGYYWPTMIANVIKYAQRCKAYQINTDFIYQPPELLHLTVASWSFEAWGIDIVGPIDPSSMKGHWFILAITDYFSKWAEAIPPVSYTHLTLPTKRIV